jgi:nicotinamide-nucleotide amidase
LADALGTPLERDEEMVGVIEEIFASRGREVPESNRRQAERPKGSVFIRQVLGTAPGLVCPVAGKVVYALPGVPHEMEEMLERAVIPDLRARAGGGGVILSRTLRTWGLTESALADRIADLVDAQTNPTLAFLAGGIEGIKVRVTAKAPDRAAAGLMLDEQETRLRERLAELVFGVDDDGMEDVVGRLLADQDLSVGVAESLTGGLVGSRLAEVEGATRFFQGSIVSYASRVKFDLLGVPEGPVVSAVAARAMAEGARRRLEASVGIAVTGVAGPTEQDGQPVGTVFMGVALDSDVEAVEARLPGDRERVRQYATISLLDLLRRRLLARQARGVATAT